MFLLGFNVSDVVGHQLLLLFRLDTSILIHMSGYKGSN